MAYYVFKISKERDFQILYYTGEVGSPWSQHIENAESLPTAQHGQIIASLAKAHYTEFEKGEEPEEVLPPHRWWDD